MANLKVNSDGWMTAVGSAITGFFLFLPSRTAGYFFIVLIDNYGMDRQQATYPLVSFGVLKSLTGPLTGYLGMCLGLKWTTALGCLLAACGIGATFFSWNVTTVTLTLGVVYGIGFGLGSNLIPEILKPHFADDINLAYGIYGAGAYLGSLIMPPVLHYLTNELGCAGMFLILGAISLNGVIAAMILRTPTNIKIMDHENISIQTMGDFQNRTTAITTERVILKSVNKMEELHEVYKNIAYYSELEKSPVKLESNRNQKQYYLTSEIVDSGDATKNKVKATNYSKFKSNNDGNEKDLIYSSIDRDESKSKRVIDSRDIPLRKSEMRLEDSPTDNKKSGKQEETHESQLKTSFRIFLNPTFYPILLVQSACNLVVTLMWTILMDFCRDIGIPDDKSLYYLMFLPLAELLGSLCLGWISDRGYMSRTNYCMTCYFVMSTGFLVVMWSRDFFLTMVGVWIFGCATGTIFAIFPGIVFEFIDKSQQSMALSCRTFLYPIFCVLKSPIIGFFRGTLGSYDYIFYLNIIICLISTILLKITPLVASNKNK